MIVPVSIEVEVRLPSPRGYRWTAEHAAEAVGKPLVDRRGDSGEPVGTVIAAELVGDELVLRLDVEGAGSAFPLDGEALSVGAPA